MYEDAHFVVADLGAGKCVAHSKGASGLRRKGARTLWGRVHSDGSYLSASDPRLVIGLAGASEIDSLVVHWLDGKAERFQPLPLRRYTTITQGTGERCSTHEEARHPCHTAAYRRRSIARRRR